MIVGCRVLGFCVLLDASFVLFVDWRLLLVGCCLWSLGVRCSLCVVRCLMCVVCGDRCLLVVDYCLSFVACS